jgi:16S rRNA (cytidine1402-2'-O)-methyltransferase
VAGTLYIVATPLGNLDDLSPRALEVLRVVKCVACEDTRRSGRLLERYGVATRTVSCHRFNEAARLAPVLEMLASGDDVALISDGGTPAVSDPGARLVEAALDRGVRVSPVPGPSAVIALVSASGLTGDRFVFDGFLPHRAGERRRRLRELRDDPRTVVVYETPHRIHAALRDMDQVLGPRTVVLGRELTKLHETVLRGTPREILDHLGDGPVRGEITLAIRGADGPTTGPDPDERARRISEAWSNALSTCDGNRRDALRRCARELGIKRAELQRLLAELGETDRS